MKNCLFCKIIKGEAKAFKIYEDEVCFAFLDINPISEGHTLVVPKIHIDDILDSDPKLYRELWISVKDIAIKLRSATEAKRIGMAVEGFTVPHLHIHLVPVNGANELDPNRAVKASLDKLYSFQKKISSYF